MPDSEIDFRWQLCISWVAWANLGEFNGDQGGEPGMEKSARAQMQRSSLFFHGLVLFVAAISVHDAAMVVLNHQVMIDVEENPVGRWLIELNQGRVGLFVALKLAGTAVVCTSLKLIYERHPRIGLAVAVVLALIQAMLLVYLCVK